MQLCHPPFRGGRLARISWLPTSVTLVSAFSIAFCRLFIMVLHPGPNHYSISLLSFLVVWLCTTLDHFGYPAPLFSVWRQAQWYNLHLTEVWLHEIHQNIIDAREPLPMIGVMLADLPPQEGERLRVLTYNCSNQCSPLLFQPGTCHSAHSGPERNLESACCMSKWWA